MAHIEDTITNLLTLALIASFATLTNPISSTSLLGCAISSLVIFSILSYASVPGVPVILTAGLEAAQKITASHPYNIPSRDSGFTTSTPDIFLTISLSLISSITRVSLAAFILSTISTVLRVMATTFMLLFNRVLTVSPPVYPEAPKTATFLISPLSLRFTGLLG